MEYPSRATARATSGFTLIEVVVTLIIMGIMAVLTVPAFLAEDRSSDIELARAGFEELFRVARDSAVVTGREVLVTVDSATGMVWFETRGQASDPPAGFADAEGSSLGGLRRLGSDRLSSSSTLGSVPPPGPGRQVTLELPPTVRAELGRARASFLFSPGGAVMGDTIVLRGPAGQVLTLHLDPWSGRARSD